MRKHIVAFGALLLTWALPASAQADRPLQIRLSVSSKSVLVGEPAILSLRVENTSGKDLVLPARPAWHMLRFGRLVFSERPATETANGYEGGPTAGNPVPVYASKEKMAPGEILVLPPLEIRNGNPGPCRVLYRFDSREVFAEINIKTRATEANEDVWKGVTESEEVAWEVKEPQGEDLLAMQAYRKAVPNALRGLILENWADQILARFPTSTYAGYVLRAPPASFGCSTYDCFDSPEETLRRECDRGGGDKPTQECMRKERERMEGYAKHAAQFLEAHPDFFDAPRIRRYLAYCLAFTGRVPEALTQLRILAEGTGAEAQEAKAFLEKRAASKCRG